jgi:cytochrome P450
VFDSFHLQLIDEARQRHKAPPKAKTSTDSENGETESKPEINFIIDQLINHEEKYSDQEIRDHLLTLQITASDTTMNLVSACFMYLAINQDVQQKVYDEIVDVTTDDEELDYEQISRLKYLEKCLKETLRLFSPLPMAIRDTREDCDLSTGKTVRKGTKIFFMSYILNQRKDIWGENSAKFDPENFSADNSAKRDPYSFAPFGSVRL